MPTTSCQMSCQMSRQTWSPTGEACPTGVVGYDRGMTDEQTDEKMETIQAVVDRVSSWQDGATEGTVEGELRDGFGRPAWRSRTGPQKLSDAIQGEHGAVSARRSCRHERRHDRRRRSRRLHDDATVEAVGKSCPGLRVIEDARGSLYRFHRLSGTADFTLGRAVDLLRRAGHDELADRIERELVGRNVLPGMWTFRSSAVRRRLLLHLPALRRRGPRTSSPAAGGTYEARLEGQRRTASDRARGDPSDVCWWVR